MGNPNPEANDADGLDHLLPALQALWADPAGGREARQELARRMWGPMARIERAALARMPGWVAAAIDRSGLGGPGDDILMRLLDGPCGFQASKGKLTGYVRTMVRNACVDLQRKVSRKSGGYRTSSLQAGDPAGDAALAARSMDRLAELEQRLQAEERREELLRLLQRFAADCPIVREMADEVGRSGRVPTLAELGARLNLGITQVHRRLSASRATLRDLARSGGSLFARDVRRVGGRTVPWKIPRQRSYPIVAGINIQKGE
jgi:DNA-directed RNA polymerase specialized sigma24 family protein